MWDELNRWWVARRGAARRPPDGSEMPAREQQPDQPAVVVPTDPLVTENRSTSRADPSRSHRENTDTARYIENAPVDARDPLPAPEHFQGSSPLYAEAHVPEMASTRPEPVGLQTHLEDDPGHSQALIETAPGADATIPQWLAADADTTHTPFAAPRLLGRRRGRRLIRSGDAKAPTADPKQRLTILDCWLRSGLPAKDFGAMAGLSRYTLYSWKKQFRRFGPGGLTQQSRGTKQGSRIPELTQRAILMLKQTNPDWGCERFSAMLLRGQAMPAGPSAVARVLHEAGYQLQENPTRPRADKVRHFERARPNQRWQTDLFSVVLERQNRRDYVVAFLDDHSRFIVSFGVHASQSTAPVLEVFRAGLAAYGAPEEVLTDSGTQFVTWRGESAFHNELTQRAIRHIVAA
ncbi:MAG: transposase, partial [Planctomycetota bacterium]|nr:transposase [Planctomycetota bacterium]